MTESNIQLVGCVSDHATEYRPSRMHKLVASSATSIVFQVWLCILVLLLATTIAVVFSSNPTYCILRSSLIKVNIGIILTLHPMAYQNDASQRLIWCYVVFRRNVLWCLRCQRPPLPNSHSVMRLLASAGCVHMFP